MQREEKKRGNAKGRTSEIVAERVRYVRKAFGLDLARLSERLTEVGWPIPVPALSRLENGNRRIDVDDLVAIAAALTIPPSRLLLGNSNDDSFGTAMPDDATYAEARAWFEGKMESFRANDRWHYWRERHEELSASLPRAKEQAEKYTQASEADPEDKLARKMASVAQTHMKRTEASCQEALDHLDRLRKMIYGEEHEKS